MDNVNQDFTLAGKFDTRSGTLLLVVTHIKNAGDSIAKGKAFTKPDSLYYDLVIKQEKDTVRLTARANKRTNPNAAGEWIGSSTGTGLGMNITEKLNMHILPLKIQMEKTITPQPVAVKRDTIPTRKIEIQKTLVLDTSYITIDLYDNGVIDGDIATVLLDGKPILEKKLLSTQAASISLNLSSDPAEHILELFAENMGSIPPNTALLVLTCKRKRYEINLSSSEAVNGSVLLKFRKPKPSTIDYKPPYAIFTTLPGYFSAKFRIIERSTSFSGYSTSFDLIFSSVDRSISPTTSPIP